MTTINALNNEFKTDANGIIKNPGKFEGETLATPFYYDIMLDGEGCIIKIELFDRLAFDIDDKYNYVFVSESNDGFVSLVWCETREQAEQEDDGNYLNKWDDDFPLDEE